MKYNELLKDKTICLSQLFQYLFQERYSPRIKYALKPSYVTELSDLNFKYKLLPEEKIGAGKVASPNLPILEADDDAPSKMSR